jgi:hypothetical protein
MAYTREQLIEALHKGPCTVTFTKVNGEVRVMPCTLQAELIPLQPIAAVVEGKAPRKVSLDTVRVFCTDKQEWRSFRVDSVITLETNNG